MNYDRSASEILAVRMSSGRPDIDMVLGSDLKFLRLRKRTALASSAWFECMQFWFLLALLQCLA